MFSGFSSLDRSLDLDWRYSSARSSSSGASEAKFTIRSHFFCLNAPLGHYQFLCPLQERGILISMDARGRALDNVFIERLWRSLKYELIYPRRLRQWPRSVPGLGKLLPFLQPSASSSSVGVSNAGRPVPIPIKKEKTVLMMRALPSSTRDLTLLLPEWMLCALPPVAYCRTLEMLARGTRLAAGTRPEHRCKSGMGGGFTTAILLSPLLHLRTAGFSV